MNQEQDREARAKVNACIDPTRGTMVGMTFEAVYEIAAENVRLRETLRFLSEHEPSWSDDFLRARAALIGVEATLGGATIEKTGSAP